MGTAGYEHGPVHIKLSKQEVEPHLRSNPWGISADIILAPPFMAFFLIPGLILGSILKGFSFVFSDAREAQKKTKDKLTPKDISCGSKEKNIQHEELENNLKEYLNSGQKTNTLVIHTNEVLTPRINQLIRKINPKNLVIVGEPKLVGNLKDEIASCNVERVAVYPDIEFNDSKSYKWDLSCLDTKIAQLPEDKLNNSSSIIEKAECESSGAGCHFGFFTTKHKLYVVQPDEIDELKQQLSK